MKLIELFPNRIRSYISSGIVILFCANSSTTRAQQPRFELEAAIIPAYRDNVRINSPFSGGFEESKPTFVDIDADGDFDLFVGENNGNVSFFRNVGSRSEPAFVLETKNLAGVNVKSNSAPSFVDIDDDGDFDLFVGEKGKLHHYENTGSANSPSFVLRTQNYANISVPFALAPAFADIDGDGDFDLFVGKQSGQLSYYRNTGTQRNANFSLVSENFASIGASSMRPTFADIDRDGDLDLFLGEVNGNVFFHRNSGTSNSPSFSATGVVFSSINVGEFSAPYFVDIDNDGDLDLFVGTGAGNINFYRNTGTAVSANMTAVTADYLSVDFGYDTAPALADVDGDGDADFFAGEESGNLNFFVNTGTPTSPVFAYQTNKYPSVRITDFNSYPAFADIDGDSDFDLFVGEFQGIISFYKNLGSAEAPNFVFQSTLATSDFVEIDVGRDSHPVFADIDSDGDVDLFVGEEDGNVNYFRNIGTRTNARFSLVTESFASVNVNLGGGPYSGSAPGFADIDADGDVDLFVGDGEGKIWFYRNVGTSSVPNFALESSHLNGIDVGLTARPTFTDIDNDGDADLFIGEHEGGLFFYRNVTSILEISPTVLDFGSTTASLDFQIINTGKDPLVWTLSTDKNWIVLSRTTGTTIQTDFITVSVERTLLSPGTYSGQISITSNGGSKKITVNLTVINVPAQITHTVPPPVQNGEDLQIEATIVDDRGIPTATLMYRRGGEGSFKNVSMSRSDSNYRGTIPGNEVTSSGVEYFFIAMDADGITSREPDTGYFSVRVVVPAPGVVKQSAQPAGTESNAYRLISLPLEADNQSPNDVLADDLGQRLGSDGKAEWRLFALRADQSYTEYKDQSSVEFLMIAGRAFWLIVRDAGKIVRTGPGKTNPTDQPFEIPLHFKWNFIANPFNFRIPTAKAGLKSGKPLVIRSFVGDWNDPLSGPVTELRPFEGYAVYNSDSLRADTLLINPDLSTSNVSFAKRGSRQNAETLRWSIRILAQNQNARDVDNSAAVCSNALRGRDEIDQPEPPVIGEYVSVYFPCPQKGERKEALCIDARPEPAEGEVWEFEVKTNIRDRIQLTFDEIESVPPEFDIWLIDERLQIAQNLREANKYSVTGVMENQPKRLKLVVGRGEFVDEKRITNSTVPSAFELSQNFPNPFSPPVRGTFGNPTTAIRYAIPTEQRVTLKVYNLLGDEIVTLVDNQLETTGYHVAIWDGRNHTGDPVASGIYFYELHAGSFVMVKKMALMR